VRLTIFAATGGAGRCVLEQAVAAGHDVTAVVRNPDKLSMQVRVVTADLAAPIRRRSSPRSTEPTPCSPDWVHGAMPSSASSPGAPRHY
jgi:nucleoside-diphosphate-sugar epimerase